MEADDEEHRVIFQKRMANDLKLIEAAEQPEGSRSILACALSVEWLSAEKEGQVLVA